MKELKADIVHSIKGKRIRTKYYGYRGQDGEDEFIVGEIRKTKWIPGFEPYINELFTKEGRNTCIRQHYCLGNDFFSCSDSDRVVYYEIID